MMLMDLFHFGLREMCYDDGDDDDDGDRGLALECVLFFDMSVFVYFELS